MLASLRPLLLFAALALAALLGPLAPRAAAAEKGAVVDLTWGDSRADVDRTVALLQDAGVRWVRMNVSWSGLEAGGKGAWNAGMLTDVDYAVDAAHRAGLQVLMPMADGVPYWASADPSKAVVGGVPQWNHYWRPVSFADYADAFGHLVRRYSARGVHDYEVWNEPNLRRFWPSGPDPAQYAAMLHAAAPAIRAADPSATIVLGGLSKSDYPWLERLYAAGVDRSDFDAVAIHPYTGSVDPKMCWKQAGTDRAAIDAFCAIDAVHDTMRAAGDGDKPLWLTEFGWSTYSGAYGVSEERQAEYLARAFRWLEPRPWVKAAFWYSFRNNRFLGDAPADFEANTGLLRTDFTPKPAYAAMRAYGPAAPAPPPPPAAPTPPPPSVPAAPAPTGTPAKPPAPHRRRPARRRVTRSSAARHGARVVVRGRVRGAGRVRITVLRRHRHVRHRVVAVHANGRFRARLHVPRHGRIRILARCAGMRRPAVVRLRQRRTSPRTAARSPARRTPVAIRTPM
jgi:polysaccharide biosynthesis protein PslG